MKSKPTPWRRCRVRLPFILSLIAVFTVLGVLMVDLRSIDPSSELPINSTTLQILENDDFLANMTHVDKLEEADAGKKCATVEEMGEIFRRGYLEESLRVRRIIRNHFAINGASRVRELHPEEFCNHGFVIGKASEAGLGNELYKILTAAALSVMLNRSLIIAQTRHIGSLSSLSVCVVFGFVLCLASRSLAYIIHIASNPLVPPNTPKAPNSKKDKGSRERPLPLHNFLCPFCLFCEY